MVDGPRALGLDIGGANLKAARSDGVARTVAFAVWRDPEELPHRLSGLVHSLLPFDTLAVTMTAELCDCFETKDQGVLTILDAVERLSISTPITVWQRDGHLVSLSEARQRPQMAAAANWLALATCAGRFAPVGPALMLDCGSTTTDIIPLLDGQPVPRGRTDLERLTSRELVYLGVGRTPVSAVLQGFQLEGNLIPPAAELFATTLDAFLLTRDLPENPADCNTADSRPATRAYARARLARMICGDVEEVSLATATAMAEQIRESMVRTLALAIDKVVPQSIMPLQTIVLAGSGEFLLRRVLDHMRWVRQSKVRVVSMAELLGPAVSEAACAYGLALIAQDRFLGEGGAP